MSKQKDQKRKAQLSEKAKNESFKFQVEYARQQRGAFIAADAPELMVEVDAILALRDIVDGVRREFGIEPENERCSLNGAIVPYLLGITTVCPDSADTYVPGLFLGEYPLQVVVAYDNEVRNQVVDWAKARFAGMTTRLGQPILKLPKMVVEFKRILK